MSLIEDFKHMKWLPLAGGALLCVLGLTALVWPGRVAKILPLCIGAAILGLGLCEVASGFLAKSFLPEYIPGMRKLQGFVNVAVGLVFLLNRTLSLMFIAVVLGASASQTRFNEARAMLDYGFNGYKRVTVLQKGDRLGQKVKVHLGMQDEVDAAAGSGLSMLIKLGQEKQLGLEVELPEEVEAPLKAGDALGVLRVKLGDRVVARLAAVAAEDVGMPGLLEGFLRLLTNWR